MYSLYEWYSFDIVDTEEEAQSLCVSYMKSATDTFYVRKSDCKNPKVIF